MNRAAVAVVPSQQDSNPVNPAWSGGFDDEMGQMRDWAKKLAAAAAEYPALVVKVFEGKPYSASDPNVHLQTLYQNEQAVKAWLDSQIGQDGVGATVALNAHTDSGTVNQIGRYWDGDSVDSKGIADAEINAVRPYFPGCELRGLDYGARAYVFATELKNRHRAHLLELGTHVRQDHTEILRDHGTEISHAILGAICAHLGVPGRKLPPPPSDPDLPDNSIDAYLAAHPEYGVPREGLRFEDRYGIEYCHTTATAQHRRGSLVVRKPALAAAGLNPIDVMTWD